MPEPHRIDTTQLLHELEQANTRLLQSEKLAAIGQLAAGVAHEINNPIGYVASNLRTLAGYVEVQLRIIDAVDTAGGLDELQALKRRLEYDHIRGDVLSLLDESAEGIERVTTIIRALRDFSHIEEQTFRPADLHAGLDATLNLVNNELKYKARVVKHYGELPSIDCLASQINQVALNLLTNAVHAIDKGGTITLRTGHQDAVVWFEVEDDGHGITAEHLPRLFEPFFTTKAVGEGTGLGLALSFRIIEKHGGHIEIDSEPGRGSRFRVWLPVVPPAASPEASAPA
ncbi:MAG TPA: ATP-binding protein [Halomonas sp.]|nr:ATP-binding protein [Halomonas sp.]